MKSISFSNTGDNNINSNEYNQLGLKEDVYTTEKKKKYTDESPTFGGKP